MTVRLRSDEAVGSESCLRGEFFFFFFWKAGCILSFPIMFTVIFRTVNFHQHWSKTCKFKTNYFVKFSGLLRLMRRFSTPNYFFLIILSYWSNLKGWKIHKKLCFITFIFAQFVFLFVVLYFSVCNFMKIPTEALTSFFSRMCWYFMWIRT